MPERVPFETSKEVVENIKGRMVKNKNKDIQGLIYAIRNEEKLKDKYKYEYKLNFELK